MPSQLLLGPHVIEIEHENAENLTRKLSLLQHLGIVCESFGQNSLLIRGVPFWLNGRCLEQIFLEINALPFWRNWEHAFTNHLEEIVARLACHSSVRSGQSLSREETEALIAHLVEVDSSVLCPHERPVMCRWSKQNLELLFSG